MLNVGLWAKSTFVTLFLSLCVVKWSSAGILDWGRAANKIEVNIPWLPCKYDFEFIFSISSVIITYIRIFRRYTSFDRLSTRYLSLRRNYHPFRHHGRLMHFACGVMVSIWANTFPRSVTGFIRTSYSTHTKQFHRWRQCGFFLSFLSYNIYDHVPCNSYCIWFRTMYVVTYFHRYL